jgi:ligand-binding SRPBCC domain-containing protein
MSIKVLKTAQLLPVSLEEAWAFFSSPANLNDITPETMSFRVLSELPEKIYPGLIINYKVAPVFRIPLNWTTEITHVSEGVYFVDEQRSGPYHIWHHEHHFEEREGGVLMTDILHYDIGKWLLGRIAGALYVDAQVKAIFDYRYKKLERIFPKAGR